MAAAAQSFAGDYYDGRTAARHEVTVRTTADGLRIRGEDLAEVVWPYEDLALLEEVYRGRPVRLRCGDRPARLSVPDAAILEALAAEAPQLAARNLLGVRHGGRVLAWGGLTLAAIALMAWSLPRLAEPVAALIPVGWEEALGARVVEGLVYDLTGADPEDAFCAGERGTAVLDRLVERLASTVDTPYRFAVRVARAPGRVNAFAAPGGQVVMLSGLIDEAASPEVVAGVLAHEMGHVVERHATEGIVRALGLAAIIGAVTGDAASVGASSAQLGAALLTLSYSREAEAEADRRGVDMLNAAGISAAGLADFFDRLAGEAADGDDESGRRGRADYGGLLRSHPASRARAEAIRAAATGQGPAMSAADWQALKSICRAG